MNRRQLNYKEKTIVLILAATAVRLLLSSTVALNNDEVYYWAYAKHLQWNYFDHPPMVAICIRFFTAGLQFHNELFVRLSAIVASGICTWLIFLTGRHLKDARTGWIIACLFTASFYSSIIAGTLILPDSPQLVFWLWSVYMMVKIIREQPESRIINRQLLLMGAIIGFCMLSKVHGIFCWAGFGSYLLFYRRDLLRNPYLYISVLITLGMLIPSLLWSLQHHSGTYTYHSGRISNTHFQPESFARELLGTILYNNPVNIFLLIMALLYYRKHSFPSGTFPLLLCVGFPLIATVLFLSLFNDTFPHWSGPGYTTLLCITGLYLSEQPVKFTKRAIIYTLGVISIAVIIAISTINHWPGTLGSKKLPEYGNNDATLDMYGWKEFGQSFQHFYRQDSIAQGGANLPRFIFTDYWFPAAHLDFYAARPLGLSVKATGPLQDIHHFAWLNDHPPFLQKGENAYYITVSNFYHPPPDTLVRNFNKISTPFAIAQYRNGKLARYFYIFRLEERQ